MHCSWTERYHEVNVNIGRQTFSHGGPALKININNQQLSFISAHITIVIQ